MPIASRTRQAENDLTEIALYIAADSPDAAYRFLDRMEARLTMLAREPELGELRPELAPELRSFVVGNYVVFYKPETDGIVVARVVHSARDVDSLF